MVWDPIENMRKIQKEMDRLFFEITGEKGYKLSDNKDLIPIGMQRRVPEYREPLADILENDKEITITLELPGINKKDIQLSIRNNSLEIKVEHKEESKIKKEGTIKIERSYKGFYRSLTLPCEVIAENAKADYKNGILEITVPKKESAKKKKITID